jgi:hypothetical protein
MECLDQLTKSVWRDEVMLFAGDGAAAEALIIDMATVPEIDLELWTTQAESVLFRVRKDDGVELGLRFAFDAV